MRDAGDGYRLIEVGETLIDTDEFYRSEKSAWIKTNCPGSVIKEPDFGWFRRKIEQPKDIVSSTIDERGKIYGEPQESMTNIGVAWTAILQQHFGITLPNAIPPWVVANMLVAFKLQRTLKGWHEDNYIDAEAYLRFAKEGQKK